MIGMKISVATSMMVSVRGLETLSHTVRLETGSSDEGMMNGNIDTAAVPMMPVRPTAEAQKAAKENA